MHSNIHTSHTHMIHKGDDDNPNNGDDERTTDGQTNYHTDHNNNGIKKKSKKVACVACHKAHARCDRSLCGEQRSCSRCIKLGIQCVEQIKKKTTREERLRCLQEQRKNSLNMKILPKSSTNNNTQSNISCSTSDLSSTSTSPHSKISPSTPSYLNSGNLFNNQPSPSFSSSQSSSSSTNSESHISTCSSSNNSPSAASGYSQFQQVVPPSLRNSQLVSFGQSMPSPVFPFQNRSPQPETIGKQCEVNYEKQPNQSFQSPFLQTIRNSLPFMPTIINLSFNNNNIYPTQSTQLGLSFYPTIVLQTSGMDSFTTTQTSHQHMHHQNPVLQKHNTILQPSHDNHVLEADNQSTYTNRIFPSSSRNAEVTEILDSYSLPNPDDLEQLFSSLENARNV